MITKINEPFNFIFVKHYDVEHIADYIKSFDAEWYYDTTRQETFKHHKHTTSYPIYEMQMQKPFNVELKCQNSNFVTMIDSIFKDLELVYNGHVTKAIFINLPAGKKVDGHYDEGDYLGMVRRVHIPIITNPDVDFIINEETKNMKLGDCWEINNSRFHEVNNRSKEDRVHLLIDILPNHYYEDLHAEKNN